MAQVAESLVDLVDQRSDGLGVPQGVCGVHTWAVVGTAQIETGAKHLVQKENVCKVLGGLLLDLLWHGQQEDGMEDGTARTASKGLLGWHD